MKLFTNWKLGLFTGSLLTLILNPTFAETTTHNFTITHPETNKSVQIVEGEGFVRGPLGKFYRTNLEGWYCDNDKRVLSLRMSMQALNILSTRLDQTTDLISKTINRNPGITNDGLEVIASNFFTSQPPILFQSGPNSGLSILQTGIEGGTFSSKSLIKQVQDGKGIFDASTYFHEFGLEAPLVKVEDGDREYRAQYTLQNCYAISDIEAAMGKLKQKADEVEAKALGIGALMNGRP